MAIYSGYFNSINGDRKYNAAKIRAYYEGVLTKGILQNHLGKFVVTPKKGMELEIASGKAFSSRGAWLISDSIETIKLDDSDILLNRIDSIVLRFSDELEERQAKIVVKKGSLATNPSAPVLEKSTLVEELLIAQIPVPKMITEIDPTTIVDCRADSNVCGFVTGAIKQVDTGDLYNQYKAGYEKDKQDRDNNFNNSMIDFQTSFNSMLNNNDKEFKDWFNSIKDTIGKSTLIRCYTSHYISTVDDEITIPINISELNIHVDILQVYINGLKLTPNIDYDLICNNEIELKKPVEKGTPIAFEILKSIDGSNAGGYIKQT